MCPLPEKTAPGDQLCFSKNRIQFYHNSGEEHKEKYDSK